MSVPSAEFCVESYVDAGAGQVMTDGRRSADATVSLMPIPSRSVSYVMARSRCCSNGSAPVAVRLPPSSQQQRPAVWGAVISGDAIGSRATHRPAAAIAGRQGPRAGDRTTAISRRTDLGGMTPEETAVSIMAEIIAVRTGRSAQPLTRSDGNLHRGSPVHGNDTIV